MKYSIPTLLALNQGTDTTCNWTKDAKFCKLLRPHQRRESKRPRPRKGSVTKTNLHCRPRANNTLSSSPTPAAADNGFARFLQEHSSPKNQRVTAAGRVVPMPSQERFRDGHHNPTIDDEMDWSPMQESTPNMMFQGSNRPGYGGDFLAYPSTGQAPLISPVPAVANSPTLLPVDPTIGRSMNSDLMFIELHPWQEQEQTMSWSQIPQTPQTPHTIQYASDGFDGSGTSTLHEQLGALLLPISWALQPDPSNLRYLPVNLRFLYHSTLRESFSRNEYAATMVFRSLLMILDQFQSRLDEVNARDALFHESPPDLLNLRVYYTAVRAMIMNTTELLRPQVQRESDYFGPPPIPAQYSTQADHGGLIQSNHMVGTGGAMTRDTSASKDALDSLYWHAYARLTNANSNDCKGIHRRDENASAVLNIGFGRATRGKWRQDGGTANQGRHRASVKEPKDSSLDNADAFIADVQGSSEEVDVTASEFCGGKNHLAVPAGMAGKATTIMAPNAQAAVMSVDVNEEEPEDYGSMNQSLDGAYTHCPRRPYLNGTGRVSQTMPWNIGHRSRYGPISILGDEDLRFGDRVVSMPTMHVIHAAINVSDKVKGGEKSRSVINSHVVSGKIALTKKRAWMNRTEATECRGYSQEGMQTPQTIHADWTIGVKIMNKRDPQMAEESLRKSGPLDWSSSTESHNDQSEFLKSLLAQTSKPVSKSLFKSSATVQVSTADALARFTLKAPAEQQEAAEPQDARRESQQPI